MDEDASPAGPAATTFDIVLRGYHRGQVDAYVQALQERCARSAAALRSAERKLAEGTVAVWPQVATAPAQPVRQQAHDPAPARMPAQGAGARMERLIVHAENEAAEIRAGAQREALAIRAAAQQEAAGLLTEHAERLDELRVIRDRIDAMPGLRTPAAR